MAALAVPALMVYRNRQEEERLRMLQEQSVKRIHGGGVFPIADKKERLTNPISPAPDCPCKNEQPCPAPPAVPTTDPVQVTAPTPKPLPPAETSAVTPPAPPEPSPPSLPPPKVGKLGVKTVEAPPADLVAMNWRDPLISPYDQQLQDEEAIRAIVNKTVEKEISDSRRRERERPADQFVILQGIVSLPDVKQAMVNGDALMEGDTFTVGPSHMAVRVVRIQENSVTFSHKGRTFTKRMSQ